MSQRLQLHPVTPQGRFLDRAAQVLSGGGVAILPTDSCYAFCAVPRMRDPITRIARIKELDGDKKLFSLIVPDLSGVAHYARVSNAAYRILRRYLPGPYTFVLQASREAPKILGSRRETIGLRVPEHAVPREIAQRVGGVLLATTVRLPGDDLPLADPDELWERLGKRVDLFLEQEWGGVEPSTMIDLTEDEPRVLRAGTGDPAPFEA